MGRLLTMAMSLKYSGSELHNIVLIRMRGDLRMLHTASCCARVIGSSWYSDSGYCQPHHPGAHSLGCRVRAGGGEGEQPAGHQDGVQGDHGAQAGGAGAGAHPRRPRPGEGAAPELSQRAPARDIRLLPHLRL